MADGLTRTQAEAELRRLMANTTVVGGAARRTVEEAGTAYIDHLEHVMERKRTTIADYRGYLRKHLAPFFGGRPLDKIDRVRVESYLLAKKTRRALRQDDPEPPQLPPRDRQLLDQARVGDGQPGRARRPPEGTPFRSPPPPRVRTPDRNPRHGVAELLEASLVGFAEPSEIAAVELAFVLAATRRDALEEVTEL
jgi:hypothetical protein